MFLPHKNNLRVGNANHLFFIPNALKIIFLYSNRACFSLMNWEI